MSLTRTLTVHCDAKPLCGEKFVSVRPADTDSVTAAKTAARDAGWYFGVGETSYCRQHGAAIWIRVKKRGTMAKTFTYSVDQELEAKTCPACGVLYAAPASLFEHAADDEKRSWYCPNGHNLIFPKGGREIDKLRAEKLRLESQLEWERQNATNARTDARRARTQLANVKKRVGAGACPDCHRTFQNVAKHMARKHGVENKGLGEDKLAAKVSDMFPTGAGR